MHRYLATLDEDRSPRSAEEYLGAFTESLKLIMQESPVERMGNAVFLAAKTALRLKAAVPGLSEREVANRLQAIARSIRLFEILKDLTPEEKGMIKLNDEHHRTATKAAVLNARRAAALTSGRPARRPAVRRRRK